jgi:hypothetical protein
MAGDRCDLRLLLAWGMVFAGLMTSLTGLVRGRGGGACHACGARLGLRARPVWRAGASVEARRAADAPLVLPLQAYFWNIHSFAYFFFTQVTVWAVGLVRPPPPRPRVPGRRPCCFAPPTLLPATAARLPPALPHLLHQALAGVFQSVGWPVVVSVVANWWGKGRRGLVMGIWVSHMVSWGAGGRASCGRDSGWLEGPGRGGLTRTHARARTPNLATPRGSAPHLTPPRPAPPAARQHRRRPRGGGRAAARLGLGVRVARRRDERGGGGGLPAAGARPARRRAVVAGGRGRQRRRRCARRAGVRGAGPGRGGGWGRVGGGRPALGLACCGGARRPRPTARLRTAPLTTFTPPSPPGGRRRARGRAARLQARPFVVLPLPLAAAGARGAPRRRRRRRRRCRGSRRCLFPRGVAHPGGRLVRVRPLLFEARRVHLPLLVGGPCLATRKGGLGTWLLACGGVWGGDRQTRGCWRTPELAASRALPPPRDPAPGRLPFYVRATPIAGAPLSPRAAGMLSTLFDAGGVAGGAIAGHLSDATGASAAVAAGFTLASVPALFAYRAFGHVSVAVNGALMVVAGLLVAGPYALITTAVSADLGTHESLGGSARVGARTGMPGACWRCGFGAPTGILGPTPEPKDTKAWPPPHLCASRSHPVCRQALATVTAIIDGTGSVGAALGPLLTGYVSQVRGGCEGGRGTGDWDRQPAACPCPTRPLEQAGAAQPELQRHPHLCGLLPPNPPGGRLWRRVRAACGVSPRGGRAAGAAVPARGGRGGSACCGCGARAAGHQAPLVLRFAPTQLGVPGISDRLPPPPPRPAAPRATRRRAAAARRRWRPAAAPAPPRGLAAGAGARHRAVCPAVRGRQRRPPLDRHKPNPQLPARLTVPTSPTPRLSPVARQPFPAQFSRRCCLHRNPVGKLLGGATMTSHYCRTVPEPLPRRELQVAHR